MIIHSFIHARNQFCTLLWNGVAGRGLLSKVWGSVCILDPTIQTPVIPQCEVLMKAGLKPQFTQGSVPTL